MKPFTMFAEELEAVLTGTIIELLENDADEIYCLSEGSKAAPKEESAKWHKKHAVHHKNIVNHWNQSTPEEKHNGKNWYKDASHFAGVLAKDTGLKKHQMAGLTANYSPQTDWHSNMMHAAVVAHHKKGIGGKDQPVINGRKMMASDHQRKAADQIFSGKHYNDVLKGHKIRHFAHLIEHGGDGPDTHTNPHVVVDRHALSVAAGARIPDKHFQAGRLSGQKRYKQVSDAYVKAADHINKVNNTPKDHPDHVHPHQVQAVTWLTRQRLNNDMDAAKRKKQPVDQEKAGWGKTRMGAEARWSKYADENKIDLSHHDEETQKKSE